MSKTKKHTKFTKMLAMLLVMAVSIACFSVTSFAAVSGSNYATGTNETFYVYSSGSSSQAHFRLNVYCPSEVMISVTDPNGRVLTWTGGMDYVTFPYYGVDDYNFNNAPAGNYTVHFISTYGASATVTMILYDGYC